MHHIPTIILTLLLQIYPGSGGDWCYPSQFTCDAPCFIPDQWTRRDPGCGGETQSPINIVPRKTQKKTCLGPFNFSGYNKYFIGTIKNFGHTVSVSVPSLATITGGDLMTSYKAVNFHMHWGSNGGPGSEHTINGDKYPMELHILHVKEEYNDLPTALADPNGIAVLGFFFEESVHNKKYDPIIRALQEIIVAETTTLMTSISLEQLIPPQQYLTKYYRYQGSLTIPACNQAVVWTVFEQPIPLSKQQLQAFFKLQTDNGSPLVNTFRPVQPLNGRQVYRSGGAVVVVSAALLASSIVMAMEYLW